MIRKNLARIFHSAATRLESDTTKEAVATKVHEYRVRFAALIMPKDATIHINCSATDPFTITPEQRIAE